MGSTGQPRSPRQHRIAHCRRYTALPRRKHLGDEERIATGAVVENSRIEVTAFREQAHG